MSNATAPTTHFLKEFSNDTSLAPETWYLIVACTATALGQGGTWLPAIYKHAVEPFLASAWAHVGNSTVNYADEPSPRRRIVRRLKEAFVKSAIIVGVPSTMESSFALKASTETLDGGIDVDNSFVREGMDVGDVGNRARGLVGLARIYPNYTDQSADLMGEGLRDFQFVTEHITYGLFLETITKSNPRAPLSFSDTEIVLLSSLIPMRLEREILWHLEGALRSGLSKEQVTAVQRAISKVALKLGVNTDGLPTVDDVVGPIEVID